MSYTYDYERPSVTADIILVNSKRQVLLIKRKHEPFKDCWALPGGFMNMDETTEDCARRELLEETGMVANLLRFITLADEPNRDPRGRVIAAVYQGYADDKAQPVAADDAAEVKWASFKEALTELDLAFDHRESLLKAFGKV